MTRALNAFVARAQRHVPLRGEVSVAVVSAEEIRELNRRFRGKDKPTDVLSFPPGYSVSARHALGGDIAICREIADENAETLGHPVATELRILALHGLLHLAGFDHETDSGEMEQREQELRLKLKLPTGLIERTTAHKGQRKSAGASNGKPHRSGLTGATRSRRRS